MKHDHETHDNYLNELVDRLEEIDENKKSIQWILKDGIWYKNRSTEQHKLADLVLAFYDNTAVPVELKGSKDKRSKAKEQLNSTYWFIKKILDLECYYGKFVVYNKGNYEFETILFGRRKTDGWK